MHPNASCLVEPLNLHTAINRSLNPLHHVKASSDFLTTERRIVMDVLQMLSQPGVQSETFIRDPHQMNVTFKIRHLEIGFYNSVCVSHLSETTLVSVLNTFLAMANDLQQTLFYFRGIQINAEKLSNVINSLIFVFSQILERVNSEVGDLQQILQFQSGLISKSQLRLSHFSKSRVTTVYPGYESQPLTLLKLEELMTDLGLFSKVASLKNLMQRGILDFVAHDFSQSRRNQKKPEFMFVDESASQQMDQESFLLLADFENEAEKQAQAKKEKDRADLDSDLERPRPDSGHLPQNFARLTNNTQNQLRLPNARLNLRQIQPADRATYLLNYLYLQI